MTLTVVGCGGADTEAPSASEVQACLEEANLDVESQTSGGAEKLDVNGGEQAGGSSVVFYPSEEEAAQNAEAAKGVTGGTVEQHGTAVVITQDGEEAPDVQECVS